MSNASRRHDLLQPKGIGRSHRVYDADEAKVRLDRIAREAYRLKRMYADVYGDSTTGGRLVEDKISGGSTNDPTFEAGVDLRRQMLRGKLPHLSALIDVSEQALRRALSEIRTSDRVNGEQVGETGTWDTERADRAEARAAAMPKSGTWRVRT